MTTTASKEKVEELEARNKPAFLRRVRIRGYKSIAFCDVTLEPLTILVGRNASGKSNFLDALAFLRDVFVHGVHGAVKLHGGREAVLCQFTNSSLLSLEIETGHQVLSETDHPWIGSIAFEIALPFGERPRLIRERVRLGSVKTGPWIAYTVVDGRVVWDVDSWVLPVETWLNPDRLLLGTYGVAPFLHLLEQIESIRTYNFNPEAIRVPQKPTPGEFLDRDGSNLASVIETTRKSEAWAVERAGRYLLAITETVEFMDVVPSGGYETLRFRVPVSVERCGTSTMELPAASMSDGTLRAFAALIAVAQSAPPLGFPSLVAIEEPETSLHPTATRALVDALDEATLRTQVLFTTHSAELLDDYLIRPENVRVVEMIDGQTVIGPVDEASVEIVRQQLDTLGGLERQNQLEPDADDQDRQRHLFQNGKEP